MTIAHRKKNACCLFSWRLPSEWSLSAGPVLWHDNYSPALQNATSLCSGERASRLINMTMGTLRGGPALDTAYEVTRMTLSSQMEAGGFDFLKRRQMDEVTASLSKLLGSPFLTFSSQAGSSLRLFNRALGGQAYCPNALPGSHCLCLSV